MVFLALFSNSKNNTVKLVGPVYDKSVTLNMQIGLVFCKNMCVDDFVTVQKHINKQFLNQNKNECWGKNIVLKLNNAPIQTTCLKVSLPLKTAMKVKIYMR